MMMMMKMGNGADSVYFVSKPLFLLYFVSHNPAKRARYDEVKKEKMYGAED